MGKVLELNHETFEREVIQSDVPVLVDFWAPWCGPCRMLAPVLDDLAGEMEGRVKIAKLDIENPQHQQLAARYQIQSIPNMKLFKNGEIKKEFVGFQTKEALAGEIGKAIA